MSNPNSAVRRRKIAVVFGTRPECIKLAPVIRAIENDEQLDVTVIISSQHTDLLQPFLKQFKISVDHDLQVMRSGQTPDQVLARVLDSLSPILKSEAPDLLLVQGDTTTALAGALSAFNAGIPVGHVEAGLRTEDPLIPFPEEMNRRLISRIARLHFAATSENVKNLERELIDPEWVHQTGNPVVDALNWMLEEINPSKDIRQIVEESQPGKLIVLTTHRRESFGESMRNNLNVLAEFVAANDDCTVVFPAHPNPHVQELTHQILGGCERIRVIAPLDYPDFIYLLSKCWLIVSDSGGVQEEAPSLGKRLIILRRNTERPEVVASGIAKLVGDDPKLLRETLDSAASGDAWMSAKPSFENIFGAGDAAEKIHAVILSYFASL